MDENTCNDMYEAREGARKQIGRHEYVQLLVKQALFIIIYVRVTCRSNVRTTAYIWCRIIIRSANLQPAPQVAAHTQ